MSKLDWRKASIYVNEPNLNYQDRTEAQKKADRKFIRKHRKKARKIADLKAGIVRPPRMSGAQRRKLRKARQEAKHIKELAGTDIDNAIERLD